MKLKLQAKTKDENIDDDVSFTNLTMEENEDHVLHCKA